jgi:hypothetical protein
MVAAHHTFRRRAALRDGLKAWGARPALITALGRELPPEDQEVDRLQVLIPSETGRNILPAWRRTGRGIEPRCGSASIR